MVMGWVTGSLPPMCKTQTEFLASASPSPAIMGIWRMSQQTDDGRSISRSFTLSAFQTSKNKYINKFIFKIFYKLSKTIKAGSSYIFILVMAYIFKICMWWALKLHWTKSTISIIQYLPQCQSPALTCSPNIAQLEWAHWYQPQTKDLALSTAMPRSKNPIFF